MHAWVRIPSSSSVLFILLARAVRRENASPKRIISLFRQRFTHNGTKAHAAMQNGSRCLARGQEKALCCFVLLHWNASSFNQSTVRPMSPIITFDIVAFAFTLLLDNLSRNSIWFSSISLPKMSLRSEFINDNTLASKLGSYRILSRALILILILILIYFRKFLS